MNKKFKSIYFKLKLLHYNNLNVFTVISESTEYVISGNKKE